MPDTRAIMPDPVQPCLTPVQPIAPVRLQAAERWWALLLKIETLGRLVWIVENTLSSLLLEQA